MVLNRYIRPMLRTGRNIGRRVYRNIYGPATRGATRFRRQVYDKTISALSTGAVAGATYAASKLGKRITSRKSVQPKRRKLGGSTSFNRRVRQVINNTGPIGTYRKILFNVDNYVNDTLNKTNVFYGGMVFTPNDILDYAAVLFNAKTPVESPTTDFNFSQQAFDLGIKSMQAKYTLRNFSQHTLTFDVYHFVAKTSSSPSPLTLFTQSLNQVYDGTMFDYTVTPKDGSKLLSRYWRMKHTVLTLAPNQKKIIHTARVPNCEIKVENLYTGGTLDTTKIGTTSTFFYKLREQPVIIQEGLTQLPPYGFLCHRETHIEVKMTAPDVALEGENQDKLIIFNNFAEVEPTSFAPIPSKPMTANLPNPTQ